MTVDNEQPTSAEPVADAPAIPNVPLLQRLQADMESYSAADRAIATYILRHYATLAFETAVTLAEKVGVSEITIGRFTRKIGYRNFKAMKNELKDSSEVGFPWLVGEQLQHFVEAPDLSDEADGSMQREVKSLLAVYRLAETPQWAAAVELLAKSRTVQIAGFQTERGIAMLLANHLQFMRDGVRLVDLTAGNYADVFATDDDEDRCLVVIDIRRYSRQSYLIAEQAAQHGIPLIVLTDLFCDWAPRFTPHVLAVPTQTGMFWSSPVALVCAVNLMVNSVIRQIGTKIETRLEKLTRLHQTFTGYAGHQPPRPKMSS